MRRSHRREIDFLEEPLHGSRIQRETLFAMLEAVADTIVLLPEDDTFTVTFRASLPLRRDIFEVKTILVGRFSPARGVS